MKIHKEGLTTILVSGLFLIFLNILFYFFCPLHNKLYELFYVAEFILYFFIIRFFRVPKRYFIKDENAIVCAADGKVVAIKEIQESTYFKDKRIQVSVFMSPFNVHVNWYPISGIIKSAIHKPGKKYPAFLPKSSMENEHSEIVIQHKNHQQILVRQIAGSLARRIVYYSKPEETVAQGQELGIIKFGSRVDLLMPASVKIKVKLHQKVRAGQNIIACFE